MIFNMVGGAGGGKDGAATLTVTAPTNTNITVSKGTKSYTKNSGSTGVAVFQGLTTGQWTVSISNGQQTQTRIINITTTYSIVIAFFAATINITYPAGSTCTVTKGSTVFTAPDTSGTWDCVVPSTGTWVVACTDGALTSSQNVSITTDGQAESITLAYFTATIHITYPATSTCTVTNSSGTTIATDTNTTTSTKTFVATVHGVGVYTITATATDGSGKSKSQSVEITSDGQSVSVGLNYGLYLFTSGEGVVDDWTPLYGGYTNAAVTSEKMTLNGGEAFYWSATAAVTSNNAIDLSGYSKLVVDVQTNKAATDNVYAWVGVSATKFQRGSESSTISISNSAAYTKISTTTRHEIEVDIAAINTGYVFVASDGTNINTTAYNIWLE